MIGDGPDRLASNGRPPRAGLTDVVDFVGEQHDLVPWLSSADLFLLPSSQESFGLAALEAMACEVPVVASRVGGIPEVIADGVTGFVCDAGRRGRHDVLRRRALERSGPAHARSRPPRSKTSGSGSRPISSCRNTRRTYEEVREGPESGSRSPVRCYLQKVKTL